MRVIQVWEYLLAGMLHYVVVTQATLRWETGEHNDELCKESSSLVKVGEEERMRIGRSHFRDLLYPLASGSMYSRCAVGNLGLW